LFSKQNCLGLFFPNSFTYGVLANGVGDNTWAYLVKLMDFETKNQFFCRALGQICHLMEHAGNDPLQKWSAPKW